jgi:Domain of unknown function (DUF1998).
MREIPLRRSQLVTTFGPGSLVVSTEGDTAIVGALDRWFYDKNGRRIVALGEYEIHEPRLKSLLNVKHLYLPPDFRSSEQFRNEDHIQVQKNTDVYIPLLRFPTWHYCPNCKTLHQLPLSSRTSWADCKECAKQRKMIQVPFVIVCSQGHISDFPWREWVHKNMDTTCLGNLRLVSTGGTTLDSLKIICNGCGKERQLRGITSRASIDGDDNGISVLSRILNEDESKVYKCPGTKPWFGSEQDKDECTCYPIAVLKNSINVYFPITISAIHLPDRSDEVDSLIEMFEKYGVTTAYLETYESMEGKVKFVMQTCPAEIADYKRSDIELAIVYMENQGQQAEPKKPTVISKMELQLRKKEFETLTQEVERRSLRVIKEWERGDSNTSGITSYFHLINRVTKLKETIVLTGFNRLFVDQESFSVSDVRLGKNLLFKDTVASENNWLPAYRVYGEGIFFTLNKEKLDEWEEKKLLKDYFQRYIRRINKSVKNKLGIDDITPRYVLLHTLAHLIINELALTCGYNAAALRERLYLDKDQSGVLIYTSSGDSDGTFGGLVRMGKSETFFSVVQKALNNAVWCSSDPVCSEIGMTDGQGINLLNGAACHSCSYVPETSCELGNLYLDRALLIHRDLGFFKLVV